MCFCPFPSVFIATYWAKDPAELINVKGRRDWDEEEEGVGEGYEEMQR